MLQTTLPSHFRASVCLLANHSMIFRYICSHNIYISMYLESLTTILNVSIKLLVLSSDFVEVPYRCLHILDLRHMNTNHNITVAILHHCCNQFMSQNRSQHTFTSPTMVPPWVVCKQLDSLLVEKSLPCCPSRSYSWIIALTWVLETIFGSSLQSTQHKSSWKQLDKLSQEL